jgi:TatD DNase family protein
MLIDAHAHLHHYGKELPAALKEIARHQIFTVAVSMDPSSYLRCIEIGRTQNLVLPSFGIHPWNAPLHADHLDEMYDIAAQSLMLGEIGLDFHFIKDRSQFPAQNRVFEFFLAAAKRQDKIINVHTKGAEKEVLGLLRRHEIRRAIIHWYSGPVDVFKEMVAMGFYFTIGIEVIRSERIREIARQGPADRILTETDNPGGFQWLEGKPGMPRMIRRVTRTVANLRGISADAMIEIVTANFEKLIGEDTRLRPWHDMLDNKG